MVGSKDANSPDQYAADRALTLRNRARLAANVNLLYWYQQLYQDQFRELGPLEHLRILEIGSGTSPLQRFYPQVLTSDVLALDYLDYVFDCHEIDSCGVADGSLDVITLTNVLHHLQEPITFLMKAATKLKPGGKLIATEPYYSFLSSLIYRGLHHESADFHPPRPALAEVVGPLTSSNMALPQVIFYSGKGWGQPLRKEYHFDVANFRYFSSLSYMATGGISRRAPVPALLYRRLFAADLFFARRWPRVFAAFFTLTLTRAGV